MAERILPTEAQAPTPTTHPYNDPDLSPIEFLTAVYRATHLPMVTRIQAASALLPFTTHRPSPEFIPQLKYIIPPLSLEPWSHICSPWPRTPDDPTSDRSEDLLSASLNVTRDGEAVDSVNLTTIPEPSPLIDYSTPPSPTELQEIKAAINKLRPDLAHLPTPEFHLCPCGHWITGTYPCCERSRDPSKMN